MSDTLPQDIPQGKHYVYTLAYPESMGGRVFYVGKGIDKRIDVHERDARLDKGTNPYKKNIIRKIWREGSQVVKTIIAYFETHRDACSYEIALIFFMDGLANLTAGGEGASGVVFSAERRRQLSENTRRQMQSEESRRRLREVNTGKKHTAATRQKLSEANKRRPRVSSETRRKIGEITRNQPPEYWRKVSEARKASQRFQAACKKSAEKRKGVPRSEETRQRISEAKQQHPFHHSEETRQRISVAKKGQKQDPEVVRRRALNNTGKKRSEETKRRMSEAGKGKHSGHIPWNKGKTLSEEQKGKMQGSHKDFKHTEETKQKISEIQKGRKPSPLAIQRSIEVRKGRPVSEETRQKLRLANLGKKQSSETIAKRAATITGRKRTEESRLRMSDAQEKRFQQEKEC